ISLDIRSGLTRDFTISNSYINGWLNLELNNFPITNGGEPNTYNTAYLNNVHINVPSTAYLAGTVYAFTTENVDVNLYVENSSITIDLGNVGQGSRIFDLQHYGTTVFKNCKFFTSRPATIIDLSTY